MLQWCVKDQGVSHLFHYLDDFITMGSAGSVECQANMTTLIAICNSLGAPIAPDKCEGPVTRLTYLGIEVDTVQMLSHLQEEKLERTRATVK